jgi:CubicO group peptidase (beta-lactamase class C family)
MTKPVTAVAMMILYEQGKWLPTDPIAKYIPEFKGLKVFKSVDAAGQLVLEDPVHPPTLHELMTHTAGFVYGLFDNTPVDKAYQAAGVMQSASLQEMIDRLAKIPLAYQPGSKWVYSVSMDVQGYLVAKLSGQSLPDFMQQHVFAPLGMKDTGFVVPADKRGRFATLYRANEKGELVTLPPTERYGRDYGDLPGMPSGGGGLVTTAGDYFRFAQMLANRGELDGVRVLSPAAVTLMSANHLLPHLLTGEFGIGLQNMRPGFGYGYNCAVVYDPPLANLPEGRGTFFWDGAAGTWFWVDPANDVVFVGMIQRMVGPDMPNLQYRSRAAVYQALVDPEK